MFWLFFDFMLMFSFTRFVGNRHSPMSSERREVIAESASSGKSTPNWSRMEEGGGSERGSTGKHILWSIINVFLWGLYLEVFWEEETV